MDDSSNRPVWRFFDGSVSISASMLLAILLSGCACGGLPLLGYLGMLTSRDDGVIIVATLLLFPTALALYGGLRMYFAAKEAVEKKAEARGRDLERKRIKEELVELGVTLTPEIAQALREKTK